MLWLDLIPHVALCAATLLGLGATLLAAAGANKLSTLILFAPITACAALGVFSLVSAFLPWSPPILAAESMLALALVLAARRLASGTPLTKSLRSQATAIVTHSPDTRAAWALAGTAACATLAFIMASAWVGSPSDVLQQYDNPFHYSVVRNIIETSSASPIGAGSVMGEDDAIYPDLWHSLVALDVLVFDSDIQASAWAVSIAVVGVVAPLGMIALARRLFTCAPAPAFGLAALLPVIIPMSLPTCISFGSLFANLLALALLPGTIALSARALDSKATGWKPVSRVIATLSCVFALGFSHPNAAFTLAVFMLPLLLSRCDRWLGRAGIVVLFASVWAAAMASPLFSRTINCLDRVAYSSEIGKEIISAAGFDYAAMSSTAGALAACAFAVIAISVVAAVALAPRWRESWYLVGIGITAAQAALSLFPNSTISLIACGFWYRDAVRLFMVLALLSSPLLATVPTLVQSACSKINRATYRKAAGASLAVAVSCAVCLMAATSHLYYGRQFADLATLPEQTDDPALLTADQAAFSETVAKIVGSGAVLNSYSDGSVWLYPLYGVNALIKGRAANQMTSMPDDLYIVVTRIAEYGEEGAEGAEVRAAVDRLGITHVVKMSSEENLTTRFNELDQITYDPAGSKSRIEDGTPGFKIVAEQGDMRLYELEPVR